MAAAEIARTQLDRDQAHHDLDALIKLNATGAASASEVSRRSSAWIRRKAACTPPTRAQNRYSPAEVARAQAALADAEANLAAAARLMRKPIHAPVAGTVYTLDATPTDFVSRASFWLQLADLHQSRVRAYFDEPEIGRLAVGQKIQIKWDAKPGRMARTHRARSRSP